MAMMQKIALVRAVRGAALAAVSFSLVAPALPLNAQDTLAEQRIRKMEAEIRALQRKVFPGGDGRFFEPEITPPATPGGPVGAPSSSAVTDLLNRMEAMESQLASLTAQIEQNSNRIAALEGTAPGPEPARTAAAAGEAAPAAAAAASSEGSPAAQANLAAMTGGASASARPASSAAAAPAAAAPSSERVRAVSAIVKPQTDDPADDEYSYGFRLWDAKFYPEAQQQLKLFLEKYPTHWRASWGRNLLGRAYLDDGNPGEAAKWFLQNYQANKSADRAPDSLLYLAVAMKQMGDTKRSCIALAEFAETYAAEAAGRLKGLYDSTRNGLRCS
jgi:TolA-binding protein